MAALRGTEMPVLRASWAESSVVQHVKARRQ